MRERLFGWVPEIRNAGSVFLGHYSPESAGITHRGRITLYPRTGMPVRIAG